MADSELRITEVPDGLVVTGGRLDRKVVKKTADFAAAHAAGEWGMGTYTGGRMTPSRDEIAQFAYSLYESRGRQDGHHMEDWLHAEQELVRHYA